ncbi:hypothetical protein HYX13_03705 [Candidatus Woesearchaeota archaeon]|nr:hypothetical protein [Candidatus Woesearchaeota archaeon]
MTYLLTKENRNTLKEKVTSTGYEPQVNTLEEAMVLVQHDSLLRGYLQQHGVARLKIYSKPLTDEILGRGGTETLELARDGFHLVRYTGSGQFFSMTMSPLTADNLRAMELDVDQFVAGLNHALYESLQKEKKGR